MKRFLHLVVSTALVALPLSFASTQALAAKKPVPKTNAARATANHNAKVAADKAKRESRMAAEKSKKAAAKAKK